MQNKPGDAWSPRSSRRRREPGHATPQCRASGLLCERSPCHLKPPSPAESRAGGLDNLGNSDKEGSGLRRRFGGCVSQETVHADAQDTAAERGMKTTRSGSWLMSWKCFLRK